MRQKYLLVVLAILLVGAAAAGGAWYWHRSHDQLGIARAAMARGDLRTAQIALRAMLRSRPQSIEAHFRLGAVQLQLGDPVAAERELKIAQTGGWNRRVVLPLLARAYLAQGRFKDVLADFPVKDLPPEEAGPLLVTQALAYLGLKQEAQAEQTVAEAERLAPQIVEAPLAAARIALARNDPATAGQKVDRALEINPRSVDALVLKGELLHTAGKYDAAVASFTAALAVAPDALPIRLERINTLMALAQEKPAREDVDAVLAVDARNPLGNYFLAVLLVRAGDWQGADVALQKISPIISRFPRGDYFQALVKINLGQTGQAADAAAKYVAHAPQDIDGYKLLARINARAGQPEQMVEVLSRAANAGLVDVELLELLGGAYIRAGQNALAVQTLERAATLASNDAEELSRIAALRLGIGDAAGAERNLSRSLELTPGRAEIGERLVMAALVAGDIERANAELEKLSRQPGVEPAKIDNLRGLVLMGQLDLDAAQAAFKAALAADPNSIAARLNMAKALAVQGEGAEAEKLLRAVLDKEPANVPALAGISAILMAQKQPERVVALMEAARRAAPGNAGLTLALVNLLTNIGETRKAYAMLDELPPDQAALPGMLAARARLQESLGMEREAQEAYRQELAANPADVEAVRRLADLLVRARDGDGAKAVLRKGLEALPGNPSLLQALVVAEMRTGGLDAALTTATVLTKDSANLPAARMLKGGLYMSVQRFADAAVAFQAQLAASPSSALAVASANALNSAGKVVDAQRLLQDWIVREPGDVDAIRALASLDLQNKRMAEAEKNLLAVLAVQPNDPVALNNLAWIYQTRNDPRARAMAQRAYLLAPGPQAADTLGWILTRQADSKPGDRKMGLLLLTQAARNLSTDATIFYHLAVALTQAGQKDKAVEVLTQLANYPSEFDDKPAARKLLAELGGATPPPPAPSPPQP